MDHNSVEKGTKTFPGSNPSPGRLYSGICNAIARSQQVIAPTWPAAAAAAKRPFAFNKPQSHSFGLTSSVSKVLTAPENPAMLHLKEKTKNEQIDLYDI